MWLAFMLNWLFHFGNSERAFSRGRTHGKSNTGNIGNALMIAELHESIVKQVRSSVYGEPGPTMVVFSQEPILSQFTYKACMYTQPSHGRQNGKHAHTHHKGPIKIHVPALRFFLRPLRCFRVLFDLWINVRTAELEEVNTMNQRLVSCFLSQYT